MGMQPMFHLFRISTDSFSGKSPRPHAVNELIGGDELAAWLHKMLTLESIQVSEIWEEDHGWAFELEFSGRKYLVVCHCEFTDLGVTEHQHSVLIQHKRTLIDKLAGRNKSDKNDQLVEFVFNILRSNTRFQVEREDE
jgi:hypothetical protein